MAIHSLKTKCRNDQVCIENYSSYQEQGRSQNEFEKTIDRCAEKAMAPHSSTLAWKIPWMEEPGRLQSMGSLRVIYDWPTSLSLLCIGEGNGNPLQCSCLENPRDGGAWWAAVYGVTQSQKRLKWLSRLIDVNTEMVEMLELSDKNF